MKAKHLIFLAIFMLFAISCGSEIKFGNPNDKNSDAYQGNDADSETQDTDQADPSDPNDPDDTDDPGQHEKPDQDHAAEPTPDSDRPEETEDDEKPAMTRDAECKGLPENAQWNTVSTITQTWSGSAWEPSTNGEYNEAASTEECRFKCKTWYTWDGEECIKNPDSPDSDPSDNDPSDDDPEENDADNEPGNIYDTEIPADEDVSYCVDTCVPMEPECFPAMESEYEAGLCNGLDDDCDGQVDEGCPCTAGQTQPCFLGPRNFRNVGTCQDGVQTCIVNLKDGKAISGTWGGCTGGISPSADLCDNSDNNCNGCVDDQLCCLPPIDCAYDINAEPARPFAYKTIDGNEIYDTGHRFNDADTATWEWTLTKGSCDIILNKISFKVKGAKTLEELEGEGENSNSVSGVGLSHFKVLFQLSGSYLLHLRVTRQNGEVYECDWILRVVSEGLRIELCWDTTGSVDVDLHLAKVGVTTIWASQGNAGSACYYGNCKSGANSLDWGYPNTANYDTNGNWKNMHNPRLDIDNIEKSGIPENINLDNPNDGDTFRIGVNYYSSKTIVTHPVVNVYCGGTLKATFGVEPQVSGFNAKSKLWKVAEVQWVGDYSSDACTITPKFSDSGYVLGAVGTYDW